MEKIYKIAVIAGDGIGPEVLAEGIKVLNRISERTKEILTQDILDCFHQNSLMRTLMILQNLVPNEVSFLIYLLLHPSL